MESGAAAGCAFGFAVHGPGLDRVCRSSAQVHEPVLLEAFLAKRPIAALDKRILHAFARIDEVELTIWVLGTVECSPGEGRPIVTRVHARDTKEALKRASLLYPIYTLLAGLCE